MAGPELSEMDWAIRTHIYEYFVENSRAPSYRDVAAEFGIEPEEAREAFRRLHERHTLFLDPGTDDIRLLNPFSAIPTPFRVQVGERSYYANCAWDSLAIPSMLGEDAIIHARVEVVDETVAIAVIDGMPRPAGDYVVNFSVPFRHWYDNLIHT